MSNPLFRHTNECLDAILAGLDVRRDDRILAIGGSGDQAFAMLAKGASVTVVDYSDEQIEYIRMRADLLRNRRYAAFLADDDPREEGDGRDCYAYLTIRSRLRRIRKNLDRMSILKPKHIHQSLISDALSFNKLYLSNVYTVDLPVVAPLLPTGGRVYVTDSKMFCYLLNHDPPPLSNAYAFPCDDCLPSSLRVHFVATLKAQFHERRIHNGWHPAVYEKVA